jgi:hypothetical protein
LKQQLLGVVKLVRIGFSSSGMFTYLDPISELELDNIVSEYGDISHVDAWQKAYQYFMED